MIGSSFPPEIRDRFGFIVSRLFHRSKSRLSLTRMNQSQLTLNHLIKLTGNDETGPKMRSQSFLSL